MLGSTVATNDENATKVVTLLKEHLHRRWVVPSIVSNPG